MHRAVRYAQGDGVVTGTLAKRDPAFALPGSSVQAVVTDAARAARRQRLKSWGMWALRGALAVGGVSTVALLVRDAGPATLLEVLETAAPWIPLLLTIEVARMGTDALATWLALGRRAHAVPIPVLARAQLIGTAVGTLAPAGRTAAEATKAALLAPWTGGAPATAGAATTQAATLLSTALISLPCAWAASRLTGASWITVALLIHAAVLFLLGVGVRLVMRSPRLGRWLARRERLSRNAATFQQVAKETPVLSPGPTAALLLGRALQVLQYGVIVHAVGVSVSAVQALFSQGLNLMALAVGVLVPGQLGVSEGAFALSASTLHTTEAKAIAIALLAHLLQIALLPLGALTPLLWKVRAPSEPRSPTRESLKRSVITETLA
ncbi:lysylphosphatidylglycerol synthase domain-containing protein [Chondromyces crocatus]|uniref:Flippase-like domain-containing protein n=1 Tax=Chondromyces crocatus TaxID=52 RepID=A0A0K1E808_CHOCO|nr:lysylphosphatidylglycerol synthase domain-containing protein [Chondromyces crocatus]AKT36817.1 uncharacterized protein CMC5_009380 [Chondromyces crocatus]